jgi:type IV pilus assembly protein PilB
LANKYGLIPISIKDNKLQVAMSDPLNFFALDDIKISSGYDIEPLISTKKEIISSIEKFYSNQFVQKAAEELSREQSARDTTSEEAENDNDLKNAPAVRMIDTIMYNAIKARASDIHMEPFEKYVVVRYRIDGELHEMFKSPSEIQAALVSRIKILANLNIAEKRIPQDGRIVTKVDNKDVDLRVSILPTVHGEKVVIRILSKDAHLVDKKRLGMMDEDLVKLERIIKSPYGIILVTGPTGSGKSTTLYAILKELNTVDKNIITVEDPVEYMMDGINQVNVNAKAGLTFAAGLRSILRQDPDIIMVGEIRDGETAEIAIRSAITGHLVLSTIHTNDAASAVVRLVDMGIESYLVATSLSGVVAQRLVRKVCSHCKIEYNANEKEKRLVGVDANENLKLYKGKGCSYCNNSGYSGRVGVYEIMEIDSEVRNAIMSNKSTDDIRDVATQNGMKTLQDSCAKLVIKGMTTADELARITFLKE